MISVFYHPYQWQIKLHKGHDGKAYLQDTDIKPKWIVEYLEQRKINIKLRKSKPLKWSDYEKVHNSGYLNLIKTGDLYETRKYSWITWSKSYVRAQLFIGGAIYDSAKKALKDGVSGALVAEGHHAKYDHGSGFCILHHLAVVIRKLLDEGVVRKIAVIDCDFHLGDGTIEIFSDNPKVRILDLYGTIHKGGTRLKTKNSKQIKIKNVEEYFDKLEKNINSYIVNWGPDLVFYIAGADVYEGDRYGGIKGMSIQKVKKRDNIFFSMLKKHKIPVSFSLGGGYVAYTKDNKQVSERLVNKRRNDLVRLHTNTLLEALK